MSTAPGLARQTYGGLVLSLILTTLTSATAAQRGSGPQVRYSALGSPSPNAIGRVGGPQTPLPPTHCIPQDAVICVQVSRPKVLIDLLAGKRMTDAVTSLPFYQQRAVSPKFREFLNVIKYLETTLETDWRTGLTRLTAGGVTIALCPEDTVVAVVDAEDAHMLERLHEILLNFARAEAEKQGHPERVASRDYAGTTVWTFDGKEAHAIVGRRFIFANRAEGLKAALDLGARPEGRGPPTQSLALGTPGSLAAAPAFQAAARTARPQAAATAFVSLKPLLGIPNIAALFEKQRTNPLAGLLFAGITESLRNSNWLALGLEIEGETPGPQDRSAVVMVRALMDGKVAGPASPAAFALPQNAGAGAWPNFSVPGRIAALSLYRDLHGFYAAKDTLFPERTSGLIFFENMMGIFFTGRDLTSEVLAQTQPEIRLVAAEQQYDPAVGTPQVKIPAVAAVLRLRHPEQFGTVVEEAWQKAVGLVNFTRGQQALPGLIIDRPTHGDTKFTVACFSTTEEEDKTKLPARYNARPALALVDEYVILSSTDGLARDLIDALKREGDPKRDSSRLGTQADPPLKPMAQTHSALEIDGAGAAAALAVNRETLVRGDMVKKGKTQAEAEAGIDMLITLVRFLDHLKLDIGTQEELTQMQLQVKLNLTRR